MKRFFDLPSFNQEGNPSSSDDSALEVFFNHSPDLFCVESVEGFFEYINPAWKFILGYDKDDLIGKKFEELLHPDDLKLSVLEFSKQLEGYEIIDFVNRYRAADGSYKWLEWKGKYNPIDKRIYSIGRDVTIQKELEKELLVSEAKYRILTESANDLVMRFDREYRHLFANSATKLYFGREPEEFLGKTHEELGFPEVEYTYWDQKIEEVFETGKPLKEVVAIIDGSKFVDWNLVPEFDADGNVISVLSYSRDITEVIKAQEALKVSENNLKQINAEKDKFFSIIAHDLRNPFNGFLGLTHILSNSIEDMDAEEIKDFASKLNTSANHLFALLNNLLEWSRMQQGQVEFTPEMIQSESRLLFILDTMEESLRGKEIIVNKKFEANTAIMADKHMFDAIFRNLISNAYKFTPRGGSIELATGLGANNTIEISVKDTGIGMDEKVLNNLFSLSVKISRPGTERESSSGLGLLLVKEYVDKHKGKTNVVSQVGMGTTFTISLPIGHEAR